MSTIFVGRAEKQLGQFSEQEVSEGLKSGRFLASDLAWKAGMDEWVPLSEFPGLGVAGLSESVVLPPLSPVPIVRAPMGKVDVGLCLSKAWETYKAHFGYCLLGAVIFLAISVLFQAPSSIAQALLDMGKGKSDAASVVLVGVLVVSCVSILCSVLSMILTGGIMYFYVNALRSGPNLKDIFAGFRPPNWWRLLLAGLIWMGVFLIGAAVIFVPAFLLSTALKNQTAIYVAVGIFMVAIIYSSVVIAYVFPLIIDRKLGPVDSLVLSVRTVHGQWWQVFALFLIMVLVMIAGVLACCIGILFAYPLGYLVLMEGYRQLFGDPEVGN